MPGGVDAGLSQYANRLPDPDPGALARCDHRLSRSVFDRVPRCTKSLLADQHAVDRGSGLQARRRVDDLAHSHRLAFGCERAERDVRFTGRDGDSRLLGTGLLGEPVADRQRSADGSLGIVLVSDRGAEERHHGVADELLHSPAEALELGPDVPVVGHDECADVLRVEQLGARCEVGEVGKEDGDDLPLLERRSCACSRRTPASEGGILLEDPPMELLQPLPRCDSELLVERPPCLTVRSQRLRLPPGAVEREHQLCAQVLAERMLDDQHLELRDQLAGAAEGKVGLEAVLHRFDPQLVQPGDLRRNGVLVQDVLERPPAPERERSSERLARRCGLVVEHSAR